MTVRISSRIFLHAKPQLHSQTTNTLRVKSQGQTSERQSKEHVFYLSVNSVLLDFRCIGLGPLRLKGTTSKEDIR